MSDPIPHPPRYRWLNRFAALTLVIALSVAGLHFDYAHHANVLYEQARADAKKHSEPLDIADFDDPKIDAQENAVKYLNQAVSILNKKTLTGAEATLQDALPSNKIIADSDIAPNAALLQRLQPMFASLRLMRNTKWSNWQTTLPRDGDYAKIFITGFNSYRELALLLQQAAAYQHTIGNDHEAFQYIRDIQALGRIIGQQPTLVSHLVYIGIDAMASDDLEAMAPQLHVGTGPRDVSLKDIRDMTDYLLNDAPELTSFRRALLCEQSLAVAQKPSWMPPYEPYLTLQRAKLIQRMQPLLLSSTEMDYRLAKDHSAATFKRPSNLFREPLADVFLLSLNRLQDAEFRHRAARYLTATKLAVDAYRADHGTFPPSLDALIPNYLRHVPIDPYSRTESPIKYLPDGSNPCVYSVFEDGVDNHATTKPNRQWHEQPDLIYPLNQPSQ